MVNLIKNTRTLLPYGPDHLVLVSFVLLHIRLTITNYLKFFEDLENNYQQKGVWRHVSGSGFHSKLRMSEKHANQNQSTK